MSDDAQIEHDRFVVWLDNLRSTTPARSKYCEAIMSPEFRLGAWYAWLQRSKVSAHGKQ